MVNNYEKFLQEHVFPELEAGRPGWDKPHTESVVEYVKSIIDASPELKLDRDVLVIAAYAHDWGYAGLFAGTPRAEFDDIVKAKGEHMVIGAQKIKNLLEESVFDFLKLEQKERIVHLVGIHDNLESLRDSDEFVLMEADTLGGLDTSRVKPSFDNASNEKYLVGVRKRRLPIFITKYGKDHFEELFTKRQKFYENSQN